jgi:riboflavin synthase alpha subunit
VEDTLLVSRVTIEWGQFQLSLDEVEVGAGVECMMVCMTVVETNVQMHRVGDCACSSLSIF